MGLRLRRETIIAMVAVMLGVTAAGALYVVQQASTQLVPVLVATRDIPARQVLRQADLRLDLVVPAVKDSNAIHDPAKLIGQVLVSPIFAGEQIRPGRINENERELTMDEVAVGIPTDLNRAVGGLLEAGDVVDIYWVPSSDTKVLGARIPQKMGEGFRVLTVRDASARATGPRVNSDPTRSQASAGLPAVVVLKVPKDDRDVSGQLIAAAGTGSLVFTKRAPNAEIPAVPTFYPLDVTQLMSDINGSLRVNEGEKSGQVKP